MLIRGILLDTKSKSSCIVHNNERSKHQLIVDEHFQAMDPGILILKRNKQRQISAVHITIQFQ